MAKMLSQNDWNFNNIGTKFELDEVIPKFETEVRADANGEIIKNRDGSERRFNTDKIIGWKYNVTIKDGQFKKKSTQVSVDNPEALVDNDYIQAIITYKSRRRLSCCQRKIRTRIYYNNN